MARLYPRKVLKLPSRLSADLGILQSTLGVRSKLKDDAYLCIEPANQRQTRWLALEAMLRLDVPPSEGAWINPE